jgi:penicillin-binding protein 2
LFLTSKNKTYRISLDGDNQLMPEETLLDSDSEYTDIEKPIAGYVFRFFLVAFSFMSVILAGFFFKVAVIDHKEFAALAFQNRSANFPLAPPRGMITDKNGQPLVQNVPIFNLLAVSRELKGDDETLNSDMDKIAKIIGKTGEEFGNFIREQIKSSSAFFAHLDLNKEQALAIEYLAPKGFYVIPDTKRDYLDGQKTSQIIGYTGKVSREDLQEDKYYFTTDVVGRLGIEAQYEKFLRGVHGNIFFSKEDNNFITKDPQPGKTLVLNIDHDLQIKLFDEIFAVLRESGLSRATGIIQDPRTGAVLAMVSFPGFDNNIFSSSVSGADYKRLFENPSKPLFNRAISGQYNPGSTIKPFIGMTALEERIISSGDIVNNDCISLTVPNPYNPEDAYVFKNWRSEFGPFDLNRAIANSCNVYFFTVGGGHERIRGLGAERIADYFDRGMVDSELGIDIPGETKGFIPTPDWKLREKGEPWYLGDTYNISIGQGDLLVTPLWLNSYVSAIANGGTIFKPEIAGKITDENKQTVKNFDPQSIGSLPFSKNTISLMKRAMKETVLTGTAQILKDLPVEAGAKTGTAEVVKGRSINSLFTVFAPYNDPRISMTVLIEGSASNQGLAIRASNNVLRWYFSDTASRSGQ